MDHDQVGCLEMVLTILYNLVDRLQSVCKVSQADKM